MYGYVLAATVAIRLSLTTLKDQTERELDKRERNTRKGHVRMRASDAFCQQAAFHIRWLNVPRRRDSKVSARSQYAVYRSLAWHGTHRPVLVNSSMSTLTSKAKVISATNRHMKWSSLKKSCTLYREFCRLSPSLHFTN